MLLFTTHVYVWKDMCCMQHVSRLEGHVVYTRHIKKCHVYNIYPSSRLDMCCIQHMSLHTYATHINNTYDIQQHLWYSTTHMIYLACRASQSPMHYPYFRCATFVYIYLKKNVYVYRCFFSREFVLYSSESYSSICICISGILDTRIGYRKLLYGSRRILII